MDKKKIKLKIFIFIAISIIGFFYIEIKSRHDRKLHDKFFSELDLELKGVIFSLKEIGHDRAKVKIRVTYSNKKEYVDPHIIWTDFCTMKNDTANMELSNARALRIGDTIIFGPKDRYIIISGKDTIVNFPDGNDMSYEFGRR